MMRNGAGLINLPSQYSGYGDRRKWGTAGVPFKLPDQQTVAKDYGWNYLGPPLMTPPHLPELRVLVRVVTGTVVIRVVRSAMGRVGARSVGLNLAFGAGRRQQQAAQDNPPQRSVESRCLHFRDHSKRL